MEAYIPIFIIIVCVILPSLSMQRQAAAKQIRRKRKKRNEIIMTNELLKRYIGKTCEIQAGSFGTSAVGCVVSVEDNWIEVETKRGSQLINADFVTNIREIIKKSK